MAAYEHFRLVRAAMAQAAWRNLLTRPTRLLYLLVGLCAAFGMYGALFLQTPVFLGGSDGGSSSNRNKNDAHIVHDPAPTLTDGIDHSQPDAPFVRWPLARVCQETTWTPGVVFQCDNNSGGIGNIRSYTLTCLRYAIAAGATGLLLPRIETRNTSDLSHLFAGRQPMDYFFDVAHFERSLAAACPQITIFPTAADVPHLNASSRRHPDKITPKLFGARDGCDYRDLNRHTDDFAAAFHRWLVAPDEYPQQPQQPQGRQSQQTHGSSPSPVSLQHPRLVKFTWGVQWEWPVWKDGPEFANSYGGLLRFRDDILELGRATAAAMRGGRSPRARQNRFVGVHLRTEHDALSFWPSFLMQAAAFRRGIAQADANAGVYLATGNATEAAKLKAFVNNDTVAGNATRVLTKHELLADHPVLLQRLNALTWDQQALVDFVVLLSSDLFLGVSPSSFSMNVAAKRHLHADGLRARPWPVNSVGDGRSVLVGKYEAYWDDWLFMYDALWP